MTDKESEVLLDLLVGSEINICNGLCGNYDLDESGGDYCSRNCHYSFPQKECYIAYVKWKAGDIYA